MLRLIRKKELICRLCSTELITLYGMRTASTLPWRRTEMNLQKTAGPNPRSIGDIGILDNNQLANGPGISASAIGITALVGLVANSTRGPQAGKPSSLTG